MTRVARTRQWWNRQRARFWWLDEKVVAPLQKSHRRQQDFLSRRPHRSFQRTRRRDYVRSLALPGYWSFTAQVWRHIMCYKKVFLYAALVYSVFSILLLGFASQDSFNQLRKMLEDTNFFTGGLGALSQAGVLFLATAGGAINDPTASSTQGIYATILVLMTWLTIVWLVRAQLNGQNPRLRDGLYRAGAPIVSLFIVVLYAAIQLLPAALAAIIAVAVLGFGSQLGVLNALVWLVIVLLLVLSIYWLTSTFLAAVIVTLPGMYPWQAIRIAGDMAVGRRVRILLRVLWGFLIAALLWVIVLVPLILLDTWLSSMWDWVLNIPVVPVALLLLTVTSIIWLSVYIAMLYRRIVDDDSAPS